MNKKCLSFAHLKRLSSAKMNDVDAWWVVVRAWERGIAPRRIPVIRIPSLPCSALLRFSPVPR